MALCAVTCLAWWGNGKGQCASNEGCHGESWEKAIGGSKVWTVDLDAMKVRLVGVGGLEVKCLTQRTHNASRRGLADLDDNEQTLIMGINDVCDRMDAALQPLKDEVATLVCMQGARMRALSRR